ncbi:MAG TPA: phosphate acyltransferase [Thermoguttaceae bacterium]|nr:phosphate acyltransferase [Thermoguttaceae bacterium]
MKKIRTLEDILALAKKGAGRKKLVLVGADNAGGLKSIREAMRHGLVKPVLVGDKRGIAKMARACKFPLRGVEIVDKPDPKEAAFASVALCRLGGADILMKGSVNTDVVLRAILDRDHGLSRGGLLSNVTVFESPIEKRLMFLTDPAVNINPDVARKVEMLRNAVWVAQRLGFATVRAAILAAVEKVNPKDMPATADAAVLARMGEAGQIPGAEVAGPYALDIAVSPEAAKCKHIEGPVAGRADLLLCPDIHSANILYKSLIYFAGRDLANAMIGVKTPLVMSSRSDSPKTKLYTIALSVVLAGGDA